MCGWMSECGLVVILALGLCQAKSIGQHDFPFQALLNPGSAGGPSGGPSSTSPDLNQPQSVAELEGKAIGGIVFDAGTGVGDLNVGDDSAASMENALLNYLYTKNMIRRMKQQIEANSFLQQQQQRKRNNGNYWKMCAFNAVSCFG